jgi:regulatory protein YycI of two-component signal transduction system YycFG
MRMKKYKPLLKENYSIGYSWIAWDSVNQKVYHKKITGIQPNGDFLVSSNLETTHPIIEIEQKDYIKMVIDSDESNVKSGLKRLNDLEKEERKLGDFYKNYNSSLLGKVKSELKKTISISALGFHNDTIESIVENLILDGWKFDLDSYDKKRRLLKHGKEIKQNILGQYGMDYAQFLSIGEIRKIGYANK